MAVLLGGRAAEAIVFGEISTGAADDLDKATDIARNMVTRFGMVEKLGQMTRNYSEETAREIDCAIRELTDRAREKATQILNTYRKQLNDGAKRLLEKETLHENALPRLESKKEKKKAEAIS
jgi:cell division protease FtsH